MSGYRHQHPEPDCASLAAPGGLVSEFPDPLPAPLPLAIALEVIAGERQRLRQLHHEYENVLARIEQALRDVIDSGSEG